MGLTELDPRREDLGRAVLATRLTAETVGHERLGPYLVQAARDALLGHPPPPHWLAAVAQALHREGVVDSDRPGPQLTRALLAAFAVLARGPQDPDADGLVEPGPRPRLPELLGESWTTERGRCPSCGLAFQLHPTGNLRRHGPPRRSCPGSGRKPIQLQPPGSRET